jgi:hypothetical protein
MNSFELFSAAIRVIGLLSGGRGVYDLIYAALDALNLTGRSVSADIPFQGFVFGVCYLLMRLYLLRGAPWIVDFAFPYESSLESIEGESGDGTKRTSSSQDESQ